MGKSAPETPNREEPTFPSGPFPRQFRGYDRIYVDQAIIERDAYVEVLRSQITEAVRRVRELENAASLQAAELNLWHERRDFVDEELRRVRRESDDIECAARQRAADLEADARHRASQMVERVHAEASSILASARTQAQTTYTRYENEAERARRKIDRLSDLQGQMARSVRTAMHDCELALGQLDRVRPPRGSESTVDDLPVGEAPSSNDGPNEHDNHTDPALATLRVLEGNAPPKAAHGDRTIEVTNVNSYSELAGFERQLANAPGVTRVYLADFDGDVARLEISVENDARDLTSQLEYSLGLPLTVEPGADSTLRVALTR